MSDVLSDWRTEEFPGIEQLLSEVDIDQLLDEQFRRLARMAALSPVVRPGPHFSERGVRSTQPVNDPDPADEPFEIIVRPLSRATHSGFDDETNISVKAASGCSVIPFGQRHSAALPEAQFTGHNFATDQIRILKTARMLQSQTSRLPDETVSSEAATVSARPPSQTKVNHPHRYPHVLARPDAVPVLPPIPDELREGLIDLREEVLQKARLQPLQVVMICAVEPGNGASFTTSHLSRMFAEFARLRVALMKVSSRERIRPRRQAESHHAFEWLLRRTEAPNLLEIASSHGAVTLKDLLIRCEASSLLTEIRQEFDLVLIDGPSVTRFREAALLAAKTDGVILVVEPDKTPLRQVDLAQRRLQQARARVLGVVFNRASRSH